MKRKRHYFDFWASFLHTSFLMFCTIISLITLIITIINGQTLGFVLFLSFLFCTIILGLLFVVYDGWAEWEVINNCIVIKKLFRKKRLIPLSEVNSIVQKQLNQQFFGYNDIVEGYEISGSETTIIIPKTEASDALVKEIKKRNNI